MSIKNVFINQEGGDVSPVKKALTWPGPVSATSAKLPASWILKDPKGADKSVLIVGSGNSVSFTPQVHSGLWSLEAYDGNGNLIHLTLAQLGDENGWMTLPDWDDASWSEHSQSAPNNIITARSGKNITLADFAYTNPEHMDILYQPIDIPIGLNMETEVYRSAISGDDDTSIVMLGAGTNIVTTVGTQAGMGVEQTTAGTQRAIRFKDAATAYIGAADATVRRCRCDWGFDSNNRSAGVIEQSLTDAGTFFNVAATVYGGLGFHITKNFGLWVGRVTANGNPYTFEVTARMKVC